MDVSEIQAALDAALNPEREAFKSATAKYAHLDAATAEGARAHAIAAPVVEALARQPEYLAKPDLMMVGDSGSWTFRPMHIAPQLILRAGRNGSLEAATWFEKVIGTRRATGKRVMPLWGVTCDERIPITDDTDILPFAAVPASRGKAWLENPAQR